MKRLYYLTDNIDSTVSVSKDIHNAGIRDWNFHVLSKDEAGLYQRKVHSANLLQQSDLIHSGERGALIGLGLGLLAAILVSAFEPFGMPVATFVLVLVVLFCTLFGAWIGGLAGIQTQNYKVSKFHKELDEGRYLIMIDIDVGQEEVVKEMMAVKHPDAKPAGVDTSIITPFGSNQIMPH